MLTETAQKADFLPKNVTSGSDLPREGALVPIAGELLLSFAQACCCRQLASQSLASILKESTPNDGSIRTPRKAATSITLCQGFW